MSYQLKFSDMLLYDSGKAGITVPVVLSHWQKEVSVDAKLDTGASFCIFEVMIYFAADYNFSRNVLGRFGFLNRVQIGVDDYQGKMYIGPGHEDDRE